ncbi:MAG: glycoside hydrolase family 10 protein [Cyanophyceae cyanobacterium]
MLWGKKSKDRLIYLLCVGVAIAALFASPMLIAKSQPTVTPASPSQEIRGVWISNVGSGVLFAPWGIDRAVKQLNQLNFNTLYPVAWNRGYTFHPSKIAQQAVGRSQNPTLSLTHPGGDILSKMVTLVHRNGMRVVPWFEYGFLAPKNSELVKRHPTWLTYAQGSREATLKSRSQNPLDALRNQVTPENLWLNPFHPEVQQFLLDLIVEVVERYPVDGIQLDDHFGLPVELGYDSFTVNLYQQEHQGQSPPDDAREPEWMRWRADKITQFMGRIAQAVRAANPKAIVSLSPNSQDFAYGSYLQDWATWVERGWVDELVLQVYRKDLGRFQAELSQPAVQTARRRIPVGVGILTGTWGKPVSIDQVQDQVEAVRAQGFDGVSFFYWESLWGYIAPESPRDRRRVFQELFTPPPS